MSADPVLSLLRPEILALSPYSSARKESSGGRIWLDANENPLTPSTGKPLLNRYPEPQPADLIARLAAYYAVAENNILVTRGSDEGIDLLLRAFCRAGQDAILITPPTYGMYAVSAAIQNARVVAVPLLADKNFALNPEAVLAAITPSVKLVFLCSPNNPTGALLARRDVLQLVQELLSKAVVVVDEAYLEFAGTPSLTQELAGNPNLVVLRTLSKAFGLAGIRCGVTIASPTLISVLQKIIAPYPVPTPVLEAALAAITTDGVTAAQRSVQGLIAERIRVTARLATLPCVRRLWPSDSNFILFEVTDSARVMSATRAVGVVLRDRSRDYGLTNCVRMTMGTPDENNAALEAIAR
ncbi:MAG: histidinol-phosphate transaminase, partial [Opitutaceae bacterium]|nr:histidinol-phosphate transaminase [Opitutaceae bacterium]